MFRDSIYEPGVEWPWAGEPCPPPSLSQSFMEKVPPSLSGSERNRGTHMNHIESNAVQQGARAHIRLVLLCPQVLTSHHSLKHNFLICKVRGLDSILSEDANRLGPCRDCLRTIQSLSFYLSPPLLSSKPPFFSSSATKPPGFPVCFHSWHPRILHHSQRDALKMESYLVQCPFSH